MNDELMEKSGYISGTRWDNLTGLLFDTAGRVGVTVQINEVDKGWLRKTVFYTVRGSWTNMAFFNLRMALSLPKEDHKI